MSDAQQQRYAAIERHYSQGQWQEVLSASTALLADLPAQPGETLRTRLILLQGHTQLYGLGQVAAAAAIYRQVLDSQAEPLLLSIARQELQRCMDHIAAQQTGPDTAAAQHSQAAAAMPWLDALGGVDPAAAMAPQGVAVQPSWLTMTAAATANETTRSAEPAPGPQQQVEQPPQTMDPGDQDAAVLQAATAEVAAEVIDGIDVIDEPEQIEVHLADPQRAEVVDLAAVADQQAVWSSAEDAELARGLLTVVLR